MPKNWSKAEIELVALAYMASREEPVGSQRLREVLEETGISMAEATVGRLLRSFDEQGFTRSVKTTRGRVIAAPGEARLNELQRDRRRTMLSAELANAVAADDMRSLLDLLYVRRAIEPEGARLAALEASDAEIEAIARLAEDHGSAAEDGDTVGPAMDFHRSLAAASHNGVLVAVAAILLDPHNDRLARLQRRISSGTGGEGAYVGDHRLIAQGLRARDAHAVENAMRDHVDRMIAEVKVYQASIESGS